MPTIIDGHNLIPKVPGMSLRAIDDERQLLELLVVYCRIERQKVEVYFDGAPPGSAGVRNYGMIHARYVPLGSKADDAIAKRLNGLGRQARIWRVVTSDRYVQAEARSHGAEVVPSEVFAKELMNAQIKAQEEARGTGEISAGDVDEWLDLFGKK